MCSQLATLVSTTVGAVSARVAAASSGCAVSCGLMSSSNWTCRGRPVAGGAGAGAGAGAAGAGTRRCGAQISAQRGDATPDEEDLDAAALNPAQSLANHSVPADASTALFRLACTHTARSEARFGGNCCVSMSSGFSGSVAAAVRATWVWVAAPVLLPTPGDREGAKL